MPKRARSEAPAPQIVVHINTVHNKAVRVYPKHQYVDAVKK